MPYYIDIECKSCLSKFKIDAANYTNKKISFSCKNCGNKISYFVPPGIDGISAPKAEISTKKIKKVKEENKKDKNERLSPEINTSTMTTDKLKLKLPSLFKRKAERDQMEKKPKQTSGKEFTIKSPVSKIAAESKKQSPQTTQKITSETGLKNVEKEAKPFPIIGSSEERILTQDVSREPLDFLPTDTEKVLPSEAHSAEFQPVKLKKSAKSSATKPALNNDSGKSMVHIPKPGMPFIAQLATPSFYKAGSARRKDYSFIVAEISRFRTALGRTNMPDPLSLYKMAAVSENDQDFTEPEFTPVNESAGATPFVIEKQQEFQGLPNLPIVNAQPTSAEIEQEAIEFERNIQNESKRAFPPEIEVKDREMEFVSPISPKESPAIARLSIPADDSKIYIPLNGNINRNAERSPESAGEWSAAAAVSEPVNENLIIPEVEIIEDSYASNITPVPGQSDFQMKIPQMPTPFADYKQKPLTVSKILPLNGVEVAPQPYPVESPQGFSAPPDAISPYPTLQQPYQQTQPAIPPFIGQEQEVVQQPQIPFYDLRPVVPQQPQQYEQPGKPEKIELPPYMQHQTATQRIPRYQPGDVQQEGRDSFSQRNVNAIPTQTTGQPDITQPSFQRFDTIPSLSQQAGVPVQQPPAAPSVPQPQGPFAQMPPEPIPPPSVTSPPPIGTQKKPAIIVEDEEEQFGPSNFGLDF